MTRRVSAILSVMLLAVVTLWLGMRGAHQGHDAQFAAREGTTTRSPAGTALISGIVLNGSSPAKATVSAYYRCNPEAADLKANGMAAFINIVRREARDGLEPTTTVQAGSDGAFEIPGLSPGAYLIRARGPGATSASRGVLLSMDGVRVDGTLHLEPEGETLHLQFTDDTGAPWSGTLLVQQPDAESDAESLRTWYATVPVPIPVPATGNVSVPGLHAGPANITAVDLHGQRMVWRSTQVPRDGTFEFVLPPTPKPKQGRILNGEAPISKARVWSTSRGDDYAITLLSETDTQGRFRAFATDGPGRLIVHAPGFHILIDHEWDPSDKPDITLSSGSTVGGQVTDSDKNPIAGVTVVVPRLRSGAVVGWPSPVFTDADGSFEIHGVPDTEVMVFVQGPGWVSRGLRAVKVGGYNPFAIRLPEDASTALALVAEPAAIITGTVRDASGRALVGCLVVGLPEHFKSWRGAHEEVFHRQTLTDAEGRFELSGLLPGAAYVLQVRAAAHALHTTPIVVAEIGTKERAPIDLPAQRWFRIAVQSSGSNVPLPGAKLEVRVQDQTADFSPRELIGKWRTAGDGTALVGPLPPGTVWVEASASEHVATELEAVPDGAAAFTVSLKKGLAIAGRVTWADGSAAASAQVLLIGYVRGLNGTGSLRGTDEHGKFRFGGIPQGTYEFRVFATKDEQYIDTTFQAEAGRTDLGIVLQPPDPSTEASAGVEIHVVGPEGGPVWAASGSYRDDAGDPYEFSIRDGLVQLIRATPGGVVKVWGAKDGDGKFLPLGPGRYVLPHDLKGQMRLQLTRERQITGTVLGLDGSGVKGVAVTAYPPRTPRPALSFMPPLEGSREGALTRTNADGRFVLRALGNKTYRVAFSTPSDALPVPDRQVPAGSTDVVVQLKQGARASITVLGPNGQPLPGLMVRVLVSRTEFSNDRGAPSESITWEPMASDTTNSDGVAHLAGLDPERDQTLDVLPPRGREDLKRYEIPSWRPRDEIVRMAHAQVVRGRVVDAKGNPIEGANVARQTPEMRYVQRTGADGTFTFKDVPPGEVHLAVRMPASMLALVEKVIPAGATNVVLVIEDPGLSLEIQITNWPSTAGRLRAVLRSEGVVVAPTQRSIAADGSTTFRGLRRDWTYTLWIPPVGDGLSFMDSGIRGDAGRLSITLTEGLVVSGRLVLPKGAKEAFVWATEHPIGISISAPGETVADGRYVIKGLTQGYWYVRARAMIGGRKIETSIRVKAGEDALLDLRDR